MQRAARRFRVFHEVERRLDQVPARLQHQFVLLHLLSCGLGREGDAVARGGGGAGEVGGEVGEGGG